MTREFYVYDIDDVDGWNLFYENSNNLDFCVLDKDNVIWFPVFMVDEIGHPTDFIGWNNSQMLDKLKESLFKS